ncbi:MAG TPA: response regulator [Azospirillum sp.]|nr:response regulator [Azospirillum sp.]
MTQSAGRPERGGAVLVVEDDPLVRATGMDLFADLGLSVYGAYSGPQALLMLKTKPQIGLVFANVRMPGMDGPTLAREIGLRYPGVRVVLTSGYVGAQQVVGFPFVPKPWTADIFNAVASAA